MGKNITRASGSSSEEEKPEIKRIKYTPNDDDNRDGKDNKGYESPCEPKNEILKVTDKELESDVAMRALYDRWCSKYELDRTQEEKNVRFKYFKNFAISVRKAYDEYPHANASLTIFADETEEERRQEFMEADSDDEPYMPLEQRQSLALESARTGVIWQ